MNANVNITMIMFIEDGCECERSMNVMNMILIFIIMNVFEDDYYGEKGYFDVMMIIIFIITTMIIMLMKIKMIIIIIIF